MKKQSSHGRHGGNRGSADTRSDDNPNQTHKTDVESVAGNRNVKRS